MIINLRAEQSRKSAPIAAIFNVSYKQFSWYLLILLVISTFKFVLISLSLYNKIHFFN